MNGYVYCFSNPSMPGYLKVGMTDRTPEIRLREANASTWIPMPFQIEFAKKVINASEKEKTLHQLLEQYTNRINPRREFFKVSKEEVFAFFNLMDGEMWTPNTHPVEEEDVDENDDDERPTQVPSVGVKGCRDMTRCFTDGQRIRHTIGINRIWIGIYDASRNGIVYEGNIMTLNKFAVSHLNLERPGREHSVNAWKECECEVNGEWVSTYSLPG